MIGLSWLVVVTIRTREPSCTSHAQPEPKIVIAAPIIVSLKISKDPNVSLMARLSLASVGSPPPSGDIERQNMQWLYWPPALLRTTSRSSPGSSSRRVRISFGRTPSHAVAVSAALALSTYA